MRAGRTLIAERIGVPLVSTEYRVKEKLPGRHVVMCQFFDKRCIIRGFDELWHARQLAEHASTKYNVIGARFFVVYGSPPTRFSWKVTVKPLLERQLARHRLKQATAAPDATAVNEATAAPAATADS